METNTNTMPVAELAAAIRTHLASRGFSKNYTKAIVGVLRTIVSFCADRGEVNYRDELGQQFLVERLSSPKRLGKIVSVFSIERYRCCQTANSSA